MIGIGLLIMQSVWVPPLVGWILKNESPVATPQTEIKKETLKTSISTPKIQPSKNASLKVPTQILNSTLIDRDFLQLTLFSTSTNSTITFNELNLGSRAPDYAVNINGKKVGQFNGYVQFEPELSPNGKYLSLQATSPCGATCESYEVVVADLTNQTLINVEPPISTKIGEEMPVISSYAWDGDTLKVIAFLVSSSYDDTTQNLTYFRITPKQVWQYDISTQKYTLIQSLPE